METFEINILPYSRDNYSYLIQDKESQKTALIDCGDSEVVIDFLKKNNCSLDLILLTHLHYDHSGGVTELLELNPDIKVYAGKNDSKLAAVQLKKGEIIKLGKTDINFIEVPAHTMHCVTYQIGDSLFVGDSLFSGGCGRLFEGTAENLAQAMEIYKNYSQETLIYFAHEYTLSNLQFAKSVEKRNSDLINYEQEVIELREREKFTTPTSIGQELKINPFLRIDSEEIIQKLDPENSLNKTERLGKLRKMKDNF